jgi:hypothetical protein
MYHFALLPIVLVVPLCAQAQALDVQLSVVHDACGSGTGSVTANVQYGVPPLTVEWSNGVISSGDTLILSITDLSAGTYSVTVTDDVGTVVTGQIDVLDLPALQFPWQSGTFNTCAGYCTNLTYTNPDCVESGIPPYTVTVDPPIGSAALTPGSCYLALEGICPGVYTVTITDANSCALSWSLTMEDAPQPQLLDQVITPSCTNGSNGGSSLLFDIPIVIDVTPWQSGSSPVVTYGPPEQATLTGLTEGDFELYAHNAAYPSCFDTLYLAVPSTTVDCGTISGTIHADLDGDCTMNGSDVPLPYRMVDIQPGTQPVLSDANGNYLTGTGYGDYTVDHSSVGFGVLCPATTPVDVSLSAFTPTAVVDFALEPLLGPDAGIFLWATPHKPGNSAMYLVQVINSGPYALTDLTVDLNYDPLLASVLTSPTPVVDAPGLVQWTITALPPFGTALCSLYVQVPNDPGLIGTSMDAVANLTTTPPDADPGNDVANLSTLVTNAWDPNDKHVRTSSGTSNDHYLLNSDAFVDYTIRFQNTGNAPAGQVYVLDTIAPAFDLMEFHALGASHAFTASLLDGRVLRFDFPGIMLPDSTSDPLGSQGFVRFRITPSAPQPGDTLANAADIFFDLNPAVRTNTAVLLVQGPDLVTERDDPATRIFPNPVMDMLRVNGLGSSGWSLTVIGLDGRVVSSLLGTGPDAWLPVGSLAPGCYLMRIAMAHGPAEVHHFVIAR